MTRWTNCNGKQLCGTCIVDVTEGVDKCTRRSLDEASTLTLTLTLTLILTLTLTLTPTLARPSLGATWGEGARAAALTKGLNRYQA